MVTKNGFASIAIFRYSIVKDSLSLDWIEDWNGRKTEIDGESIITPKAFFGTKVNNILTGVYIGPSYTDTSVSGIYAYKNCPLEAFGKSSEHEIFRLDDKGGWIGKWEISEKGLLTENEFGKLQILSEGTIRFTDHLDPTHPWWEFKKDGAGSLAHGNIYWNTDGDTVFEGTIQASSGLLGNWTIGKDSIYNQNIILNSTDSFIGVCGAHSELTSEPSRASFSDIIRTTGGVAIHYTDPESFGIEGWCSLSGQGDNKVFSLGSLNMIAGWSFDYNAIYLGKKYNTSGKYANSTDGIITIGTNGMRGVSWYIDSDGEVDFVGGRVHFNKNGGVISGWQINHECLTTHYAAIVSQKERTGLYLAGATKYLDTVISTKDFEGHIRQHGGVYLTTDGTNSVLAAYNDSQQKLFQLTSNGESLIAGLKFDSQAIYTGVTPAAKGTFDKTNNFTISPDGIRGAKWRLEASGAGAIAGENIKWEPDGSVSFSSSVKFSWAQITGKDDVMTTSTYIDANGIFTGYIDASKIKAASIDARYLNVDAILSNGEYWALFQDGDGFLAKKNITWNKDGDLEIKGSVSIRTLRYFTSLQDTPMGDGWLVNDSFLYAELGPDHIYILPHLEPGECRNIKLLKTVVSRAGGRVILKAEKDGDILILGANRLTPVKYYTLILDGDLVSGKSYFELIGVNGAAGTLWHIIPIA